MKVKAKERMAKDKDALSVEALDAGVRNAHKRNKSVPLLRRAPRVDRTDRQKNGRAGRDGKTCLLAMSAVHAS